MSIGRLRAGLDGSGARRALLAGLAGPLGLLLAAPAAVVAAPTISGVEVGPSFFSPNGDGFNDATELRFTPGATSGSVVVHVNFVRVSNGSTIATLISSETRPAGVEIRVPWNPSPLADGQYRFDITATEGPDQVTAQAQVEADSTPPTISFGVVGPTPFDPDSTALFIPIAVTTTDSTTMSEIDVRQMGSVIDTVGTFFGPGSASFTWDGETQAGAASVSGRHVLVALARDLALNVGVDSQAVRVDRDAPELTFAGADSIFTTSFPITVAGTATDEDEVAFVEASFDSGSTWLAADSMSAPGASVDWQVVVNDPSPPPGFRQVFIRARDRVNHEVQRFAVVAYDSIAPIADTTFVKIPVDHFTDGDPVILETRWNLPGLDVAADFSQLDSEYVFGAETVLELGNGAYEIRYLISPTNSRSSGVKEVVVHASTGILAGTDRVSVTLQDLHMGALVSIDKNQFDPLADETVRIAASASAIARVKVEVFALSSRRVQALEGLGHVEWNGRNGEGNVVASGVYFLKVVVNTAEEIRKVAVVRGGAR